VDLENVRNKKTLQSSGENQEKYQNVISAWKFKISVKITRRRRSIGKFVRFKIFTFHLANFIIVVFSCPIIGKFPSGWKDFPCYSLWSFSGKKNRISVIILWKKKCKAKWHRSFEIEKKNRGKLCASRKLYVILNLMT